MHKSIDRQLSPRDERRAARQRILDDDATIFEHKKREVVEYALHADREGKALTGRRVREYEIESGVPEDELFPTDGEILNIGDPWQVLDQKNITNLEYATGEEASFAADEASLPLSIKRTNAAIIGEMNALPEIKRMFAKYIGALEYPPIEKINLDDYPRLAKIYRHLAREITKYRHRNANERSILYLWYDLMHLSRQLEDSFYFKRTIQPKIDRETVARKGITEDEDADIRNHLIEAYRGKKKYHHATLVKGAFPDTAFEDHVFDRIIASWSISAHMFEVLNEERFGILWEEMHRLLKPEGVAYIWPLHYFAGSRNPLATSLKKYCQEGGKIGIVPLDSQNPDWILPSQDSYSISRLLENGRALTILGKRARKETMNRLNTVISSKPNPFIEAD